MAEREKENRFIVAETVDLIRRLEEAREWATIAKMLVYGLAQAPHIGLQFMDGRAELRAQFETLWRRDQGEV